MPLTQQEIQKMRAIANSSLSKPSFGRQNIVERPTIEEPPKEEKAGLFSNILSDLKTRASNIKESFKRSEVGLTKGGQTGLETGLQTVGQVAGGVGDVFGNVLMKVPGVEAGLKKIGETSIGGAIGDAFSSYESWAKKHERAAKDLESIVNIASLLPQQKAVGLTGKAVGKTAQLGKQALEVTPEKAISKATELAGKVVQGTKEDQLTAIKALSQIDTKGVKTYQQLGEKLSNKAKELIQQQDEFFSSLPQKYPVSSYSKTFIEGSSKVVTNPVKDALLHLEELYSKVSDPKNLVRIQSMSKKATEEGLSVGEVNQIAREYGTEFGKKAFSQKTGEALTSVNSRMYENTRKSVKQASRDFITDPLAKSVDEKLTNILNTKRLISDLEKKTLALSQKIKKRNLLEKTGRFAGKVVDKATGGTVRSFLTSFLPSNIGNKVLNSLDLEEALKKNLNKINKLIPKIDTLSDEQVVKEVKQILMLPQGRSSDIPIPLRGTTEIEKKAQKIGGKGQTENLFAAGGGMETYKDGNGNTKVRFNPLKAMVGFGLMTSINKVKPEIIENISKLTPKEAIKFQNNALLNALKTNEDKLIQAVSKKRITMDEWGRLDDLRVTLEKGLDVSREQRDAFEIMKRAGVDIGDVMNLGMKPVKK